MSHDALWDLNLAAVVEVAGGGLEEEEGLSGNGIVELLCMLGEVPADGDDLATLCAEEVSHCGARNIDARCRLR